MTRSSIPGKCLIGLFGVALAALAQNEPYRPQYHFSPQKNWTNDPNGLVYFEGEYHLFFQYNPFGDKWGHMSWGHAVSKDLVHWTQLPVALPEENGVMIYTGSTVVDQHNSSGFCTGGKPCLVAIYTGDRTKTATTASLETQNLAYSNDRGRTWTKYKGNPILDLHMADFRDPKVLWSDESKQWIMAVALPNEHKVRLWGSPDLKTWKQVSEFGPAGATSGQWECPELFELPVKGSSEKRWVLKVGLNPGALQGGSGEQYFVGKFDGKRFTNENSAAQTLWTDYGKDCYCALTFNNLPKTQPTVMIGWMSNWQYAADLPTTPWRGQMTVPRKLSLLKTSEGYRLLQEPVDAVAKLRTNEQSGSGSTLPAGHSYDIEAAIDLGKAKSAGLRLIASDNSATVIGYSADAGTITVDRSKSGDVKFNKDFPARVSAPLKLTGSNLRMRVLVDRDSIEVFADEGRAALTNLVFAPAGAQKLEAFTNGGTPGAISIKSWELKR